jgi:hydrogenase nickel incorporation protein HypA/HybF
LNPLKRNLRAILVRTSPRSALRIGELSGVDRDALQFGFDVLVKDTPFEPLAPELEVIPRVQRCPKCAYDFRIQEFDPRCPLCAEFATQCISGDELDIAYMEVEDAGECEDAETRD